MLIAALQIVILLTVILLPLGAGKRHKAYRIDRDTSNSEYAINENGVLQRIDKSNLQKKNI
jgi:hypothetical protein